MEGLIKKITTGPTPQLPSQYSEEWRELVKAMLSKDEEMRPSAGQILALPWLQVRGRQGQGGGRRQQEIQGVFCSLRAGDAQCRAEWHCLGCR